MTLEEQQLIKVGIGVLITKAGKVLLGKRKGSHGAGAYSFPGGKLDYGESLEDCARREVREETGLEIDNCHLTILTTIRDYPPAHWVHLNIVADWQSGEPQVMEPNKCEGWDWYDLDNLPSPLFRPTLLGIEVLKSGKPLIDLKA